MADFYKVKQVAELLGVSRSTVRRRIRAGKLKAEKVDGPNGKEYRLPAEQFDEAIFKEEESEDEVVEEKVYDSKFRRVIIEALKEKKRIEEQNN